jgi:hypothetical protein
VKQTPSYGFPYPECDRPLIADASDIIQVRNLAEAVDGAVQELYDTASQLLVHPDACRVQATPVVVPGPSSTTMFINYDLFNFDNTPGQAMSDSANGVVLILEDGWYALTHYVTTLPTGGGTAEHMVRFWVSGAAGSSWSHISNSATVLPSTARFTNTLEIMRLSAGDTVTTQIYRVGANLTWTVEARMGVVQILGV